MDVFIICLQDIKKYASTVALDRRLVDPIDNLTSYLLSKTSVVSAAQALNMSVFYVFLSNEFSGFALDYRSDPILQINSLIQEYKMDGFMTDHPKTLYNFLHSKYYVVFYYVKFVFWLLISDASLASHMLCS